ncbi:MAG: GntR family transcriptional regulator [Blautia sp.]|nr:GntR family transcriptional regulator [Blautia sp.]
MKTLEIMPARVKISAILRKAIYSGEYKGGDELSLTDIADKLGVSRTPVREAFQLLESEGLITLRMNKGAIVNTIDRKFVQDIFEMRVLLESEAARRAAENGMNTDEMIRRLTDLQEHLDDLDIPEYEALNQDIHQAIWRAADNHQLTGYLLELWNGPSVGRGENAAAHHYKASTLEHMAILEAIRDRQSKKAEEAMRRHILRSMDNILASSWQEHNC